MVKQRILEIFQCEEREKHRMVSFTILLIPSVSSML